MSVCSVLQVTLLDMTYEGIGRFSLFLAVVAVAVVGSTTSDNVPIWNECVTLCECDICVTALGSSKPDGLTPVCMTLVKRMPEPFIRAEFGLGLGSRSSGSSWLEDLSSWWFSSWDDASLSWLEPALVDHLKTIYHFVSIQTSLIVCGLFYTHSTVIHIGKNGPKWQ